MVTERLKLSAAKGWTRAFFRADSTQLAAGLAAAGPPTFTRIDLAARSERQGRARRGGLAGDARPRRAEHGTDRRLGGPRRRPIGDAAVLAELCGLEDRAVRGGRLGLGGCVRRLGTFLFEHDLLGSDAGRARCCGGADTGDCALRDRFGGRFGHCHGPAARLRRRRDRQGVDGSTVGSARFGCGLLRRSRAGEGGSTLAATFALVGAVAITTCDWLRPAKYRPNPAASPIDAMATPIHGPRESATARREGREGDSRRCGEAGSSAASRAGAGSAGSSARARVFEATASDSFAMLCASVAPRRATAARARSGETHRLALRPGAVPSRTAAGTSRSRSDSPSASGNGAASNASSGSGAAESRLVTRSARLSQSGSRSGSSASSCSALAHELRVGAVLVRHRRSSAEWPRSFKIVAQLPSRFVDAPGDRAFGAAEHLRRLGVGQAVDSDQDERGAQRVAERSRARRAAPARAARSAVCSAGFALAAARVDQQSLDARIVGRRRVGSSCGREWHSATGLRRCGKSR